MKKSQIKITFLVRGIHSQNQLRLCARYSLKLDATDWCVWSLNTTFNYLNILNTPKLLTYLGYLVIIHYHNQELENLENRLQEFLPPPAPPLMSYIWLFLKFSFMTMYKSYLLLCSSEFPASLLADQGISTYSSRGSSNFICEGLHDTIWL